MLATKRRINISLAPEIERALSKIAERDQMPEATKAARLIEVALEIEEDSVWENIAKIREAKGARFLSHKKAWT